MKHAKILIACSQQKNAHIYLSGHICSYNTFSCASRN